MLLIAVCVAISGGLAEGWDFVEKAAKGVVETIRGFAGLGVQFPSELGIIEWLWTNGIYATIVIAAALTTGYVFTRKEKKKLLGIISAIVGAVFLILTFA